MIQHNSTLTLCKGWYDSTQLNPNLVLMQPNVSNDSSFQCILVGNMQMQVLGLDECKNALESHGCKFFLLHSLIDHNNNIEPTIVVTLSCTPTCNG